jgi:Tol biopolymer transport system component
LSADGLVLYFASNRAGGLGSDDIWMATRADRTSPFGAPVLVPGASSPQSDRTYTPCGDDRYVMISFRTGNGDVYEGTVGQAPTLVAALSSTGTETGTFATPDCLELWFASNRDGDIDLYRAHRAAVTDPWIFDGKVTALSTTGVNESDPWLSADRRRLVFASDADGELDTYVVTR